MQTTTLAATRSTGVGTACALLLIAREIPVVDECDLCVSRPHVSNDNPFSESQFKTLKYRPEFPHRFGSQQDAHGFCQRFFPWYNHEHYHWGIGLLPPAVVHYGQAEEALAARRQVLQAAYAAHPDRFVRRPPRPPELPAAVWINPPANSDQPPETQNPNYTNFNTQVSQNC